MQSMHLHNIKQSTQIDFLPVIEGDSNDNNKIFTTLKEDPWIQGQISRSNVTIVTLSAERAVCTP